MLAIRSSLRKFLWRAQSALAHLQPPVTAAELRLEPLSVHQLNALQAGFPAASKQGHDQALAEEEQGQLSIFVAWLGDVPVGMAHVSWPGHRMPDVRTRWPGLPEIYKVEVARRHRSRGIGSLLLSRCESEAEARAFKQVCLGVYTDNQRAQTLYRRLGYEADPVHYFDEQVEVDADGTTVRHRHAAVFMHKRL